jgi:hypothetical protein
MELIVFESAAYWKMQEDLISKFKAALKEATKKEDDWISTDEAKQLLKVKSKSKMQQLRDDGLIKFSQHSRKNIVYSKASILDYLKKNMPS